MSIIDEETYDDTLGYDADHNDSRQYCEHGTFIGSWWGPDYMCSWCEEGVSVAEMHAIRAAQRLGAARRKCEEGERLVRIVTDSLADARHPYSARVAQALTDHCLETCAASWAVLND